MSIKFKRWHFWFGAFRPLGLQVGYQHSPAHFTEGEVT